jgi:hypothetical protein
MTATLPQRAVPCTILVAALCIIIGTAAQGPSLKRPDVDRLGSATNDGLTICFTICLVSTVMFHDMFGLTCGIKRSRLRRAQGTKNESCGSCVPLTGCISGGKGHLDQKRKGSAGSLGRSGKKAEEPRARHRAAKGSGSRQASWRTTRTTPLARGRGRVDAQSGEMWGMVLLAAAAAIHVAARGSGSRRRTKGWQVRI